jgi:hypothetical protein
MLRERGAKQDRLRQRELSNRSLKFNKALSGERSTIAFGHCRRRGCNMGPSVLDEGWCVAIL